MEIVNFLQQLFQQNGMAGLIIGFLILGPGFTFLRTRTLRVEAEAKAQELVNEFARQERQRADRLEEQLRTTLHKLETTEDEVSRLRLKIIENQTKLETMPSLRRQIRKLNRRVSELETVVEQKTLENDQLRRSLEQASPTRENSLPEA